MNRSTTVNSRRTKRSKQETVSEFYGIDPVSCSVQMFTMSRDRILCHWVNSMPSRTHPIPTGENPVAELKTVFGVTDVIEITKENRTNIFCQHKIQVLEDKAARMRKSKYGEGTVL